METKIWPGETAGTLWYQLFIVLGMLWLMLFVWYGPEMGMLALSEGLTLDLQNVFAVLYGVGVVAFAYLCQPGDLVVASRMGLMGTAVATVLHIGSKLSLIKLAATSAMALFSALFSLGIVYVFVYMLAPQERIITASGMIAVSSLVSLSAAQGVLAIRGSSYNLLSISLLLVIGLVTMGFGRRNIHLDQGTGRGPIPRVGLLGALVVVAGVQFFNTIGVTVLHYKSLTETSSYPFFYAGQFLAAVTAYILLAKWGLKIMDLMYVFLFTITCGFVLSVGAKSGGLNIFNWGAIFLGYAEIGTIFEWTMAASICSKYRQPWVLRAFIIMFGIVSVLAAAAGSFFANQTPALFYVSVATVSLVLISLFLVFLPVINRVQRELIAESGSEGDLSEVDGGQGLAATAPESGATDTQVEALTKRETEITQLLLEGYSSPQIADILEIKPNTVKVHIRNIYEKLAINSRPELFIKYGGKI